MGNKRHITDFLEFNSQVYKNKDAIITDEQSLTWGELYDKVLRAAAQISRRLPESNEQQVVSLLLPNSVEFVIAYLAVLETGNIAFPLDMNYKALELEAVISSITPVLAISDENGLQRLELLGSKAVDVGELLSSQTSSTENRPLRIPADQQIATLMFTSGTTGMPKAAPYTHANHIWNIELSTKHPDDAAEPTQYLEDKRYILAFSSALEVFL